ncbi:hypothetical protein LP414_19555 [Polaromonas sp. P1(28)-13]|nr:hypothetical protein LP414_19555 [Polaromonas sp. P1(28)-13]
MVQFIRQDVLTASEISGLQGVDVAFHGSDTLDDRSKHSVKISRSIGRRHVLVEYDPANFELVLNGKRYRSDSLEDIPREYKANSIVLDATTMEFPEIVLILHAYNMLMSRPRCGFIYVEPERYKRKPPEEAVAQGAAFNLSSGSRAKNAIPPFTRMLSGTNKAHLVAFLGFEGGRLSRILNDDDGHFYQKVTIVFGVPPFQATWDLHALFANSRLLDSSNAQVQYCGANNPRASYSLLEKVHRASRGLDGQAGRRPVWDKANGTGCRTALHRKSANAGGL